MAGWAGSVVWRQLAPRLRKAGHEVYAPMLSVGSRFDEQTLIKALGNGRDAPRAVTSPGRDRAAAATHARPRQPVQSGACETTLDRRSARWRALQGLLAPPQLSTG